MVFTKNEYSFLNLGMCQNIEVGYQHVKITFSCYFIDCCKNLLGNDERWPLFFMVFHWIFIIFLVFRDMVC